MPHINRVRVNNIKYNFGTQYYDDFLMRFSCRNTIYDLANGGGKSVLMLLLLQNLIPNCTLDDKQPIEKLFRTAEGSKTIHSLIEWRLSDVHVKNNYKYMLTGFCARKAKDESGASDGEEQNENIPGKENAAIEYFNYVIFYRDFNDNDIKNLPLSNGKERITYNGLKAYLRDLEKKDLSLDIKIFERKGDYQRFIAGYGLYESEWEIIRGINKTEGHVRTYFETSYKTTRKVVEDLLIEEIIQKSFANQTGSGDKEDYMAKTLLDIKDKLLELASKKEDIQSFDRQIEVIDGFASRVLSIKQLYFGREDISQAILNCYYALKNAVQRDEKELEEQKEQELNLQNARLEIESLIDGAKISGKESEAKAIGSEIEGLINEQGLAAMDLKLAKEKLTLQESINDYADYIYYKNERDEIRQFVEASLKDKGTLLDEIVELTGQVYEKINNQQDYISSEIDKETDKLAMESDLIGELDETITKCESEAAVCSYLIKDAEEKREALNKEIVDKKNKLELYMVSDVQGKLAANEGKIREAKNFLVKNTENINLIAEKKNDSQYAIHDINIELNKTKESFNKCIDKKDEYSDIELKARKLLDIYGVNDYEGLVEDLKLRNKEAMLEESELRDLLSQKKKMYERLKNGDPVGYSDELVKVKEYIQKYHGNNVTFGADYLKSRSVSEKKTLLERFPILPYSVLVYNNYPEIMADTRLKSLELGDYAVPIISVSALNGKTQLLDNYNLMFVMGEGALFLDDKLIEKETERIENSVVDINFKIKNVADKAALLLEDYDFAKEFVQIYLVQIEENSKEYEKYRYLLKELEAKLLERQEELKEMDKKLSDLKTTEDMLNNTLADLEEENKELKSIRELSNEEDKLSGRITEAGIKIKKAEKDKADARSRRDAMINQTKDRAKHIELLKKKKEENESKLIVYSKYYREGNYATSNVNNDELESKLKGLIGAMEKENTDLSDKQKLIENYDMAMEKSLQAIDYKGISLDVVKEKYESLESFEFSRDELVELKKEIDVAKALVDSYVANIARLRSKKDRLEGAISHGKSAMESKYGQYNAVEVENGDYDGFVEDKMKQSEAIKASLDKVKENLVVLQKNSGKYTVLEKDILKVMDKAGIVATEKDDYSDYAMASEDFIQNIENVLEKFEKYTKDIADKRSEFEKERGQLADTLVKLYAVPLADEIKRSAIMPQNVRETDELIDALKDICKCLELEKERIGKSIDDMEKIKDNFENQCIQTCINIKNELDRLPLQSKISMDGEIIPIIKLSVPYVKEDQYKFRMSQYIDETTKIADEMGNEAERVKYIRSRLSFKKLFSVIVTDMNGIKLNLYKRERIKEQSRYLKYEEAVGSTGQSQGIYIQFLIAIINYIAAINSREKDTGLRKVIFIDNPFGAAKDIYIWEPIFKLLKTNNVQLVVPARGVTPAITGRFDVNYILGQKLIDGRAQTVVVDYSSHVDSEKMDYTKLEFEQATLF